MTILASGPRGLSQPHHQPLRCKITGCCHTSQLKMCCRKTTLYLWPIGIKGEVPGSIHPPNWQCSRWPPEVPPLISYFTYESKSFTMTLMIINSRCYVLLGQCDTSQTEVVATTNISYCTPFMCFIGARGHLRALPGSTEDAKMWNASRFCVSSLRRGHANLLCIVPILVYVLPKQVQQFEEIWVIWWSQFWNQHGHVMIPWSHVMKPRYQHLMIIPFRYNHQPNSEFWPLFDMFGWVKIPFTPYMYPLA